MSYKMPNIKMNNFINWLTTMYHRKKLIFAFDNEKQLQLNFDTAK